MTVAATETYHLLCQFCKPQKHKFFVVAYTGPKMRYFLINTSPAEFQKENADIMAHQVILKASDHAFLDYDSYLDCSQLVGGMDEASLNNHLETYPEVHIGDIAASARQDVKKVVSGSRFIPPKAIQAILGCW